MSGPSYRMAEMVSNVLNVSVEMVWDIIKDEKSTNLNELVGIVRKTLRI
jgi:hypothetical protein